jgi:hypothetical protein
VWHASVASLDLYRGRPTPVAGWSLDVIRKARRRLADLLGGVGDGGDYWTPGEWAYHLRRRLSDAEIARIPAAWLALPAIDGGSPDEEP